MYDIMSTAYVCMRNAFGEAFCDPPQAVNDTFIAVRRLFLSKTVHFAFRPGSDRLRVYAGWLAYNTQA